MSVINITLSPAALELLFPVGSEYRAVMANAVVDKFLRQLLRTSLEAPDHTAQIRRQIEAATDVAMAGLGIAIRGRTVTLTQAAKDQIQREAAVALEMAMAEGMDLSPERLTKMRDELLERVGNRVQDQAGLAPAPQQISDAVLIERIDRLIDSRLGNAFVRGVKSALNQG